MQSDAVSLASQRCSRVPAFGDSKVRSARRGWAASTQRQQRVSSSATQPAFDDSDCEVDGVRRL
ncbi:hypothetical protein WN943_001040 [Citrus x changshan-huyou]